MGIWPSRPQRDAQDKARARQRKAGRGRVSSKARESEAGERVGSSTLAHSEGPGALASCKEDLVLPAAFQTPAQLAGDSKTHIS